MNQTKMKPSIEDVLFVNKACKHEIERDNQVFSKKKVDDYDTYCPVVRIRQKTLEDLIRDELKEKYYPGYVKYFKSNSEDCILKSAKNAQKSIKVRIKGNVLFVSKEHSVDIHEEIWKLYSKSIALAPVASKELVLAYECRSNLMLHLKKYEDCIKDIDRALSITEFNLLKVKLLARKMTCFVALNKHVAQKESLWKILQSHFDQIDGALKDEKFLGIIQQAKSDVSIKRKKKVKDEQKCFSSHTSFVDITLNDERCIIANCDYGAGEAVIITKPLIASVNPDKFYAYCSNCLSFMWAGIPCDKCSLCMYCSEECKEKAWKYYHNLECKVNPHVDFRNRIYYEFTNSIKIFIMGVNEFGSVAKLLEKIREVEQFQNDPNFMKNDKLLDSMFLSYYTLPNMPYHSSCSLSTIVKNGCFLMAYLTQILDDCIFEKNFESMKGKELAKDEDFVYTTYVMLKIMMLCIKHMEYPRREKHPIECSKNKSKDECLEKRCCLEGTIIYFHKGLMEKSCNPNVCICQHPDGKIIYYSTQPIKKMESISVVQSVPFYKLDKELRYYLRSSIGEFCKCIACEKNWPPFLQRYSISKAKYWRRTSKVQTKGTELLKKYFDSMYKDDHASYLKVYYNRFQEFAEDTNVVVTTCGQPSFASSWMISALCEVFEQIYGDIPMRSHIPKDC